MTHYFSEDNNTIKSNPKKIAFRVNNTPIECMTDHGVFSKDGFDRGTSVLLEYLDVEDAKTALDLGTGYGVVGIYLNKAFGIQVDMVDINQRALDLAKQNLVLNNCNGHVYKSDGLNQVTKSYDLIVTNPPIRAGKETVYRFFEDAAKHLNDSGRLAVVINKKHGANSAITKLSTLFESVQVIGRKKGFHVVMCKNHLTI
jgi:16S rRNA (guanine1207-N2)-methyltransferase